MKKIAIFALLSSAALTACGGGGSGSGTLPGPTPIPSSAPAAVPGTLSAAYQSGDALTSLSFANAGAQYAATFEVTQANYTGTLSESDTCGQIATVAVSGNSDGSAIYVVTPIAGGTCSITVSGAGKQDLTIPVGVTTSPISVN